MTDNKQYPELPEPCPFCGGAAELSHHSECSHGLGYEPRRVTKWQCSIRCRGCGLFFGSEFGRVKYEGGNALAHQYAIRKITEKWNSRIDSDRAMRAAEPSVDKQDLIDWAAERWHDEVANRPMVNVHRRALDGTWRQVLRRLGVDDVARLGPTHDDLRSEISDTDWLAMKDSTPAVAQAAPFNHGPQALTVEEAARDVGKWLNEKPNCPLDLRHVAMLAHHTQTAPVLEDIEQYRLQMAGISTAAIGYWKEGDSIHPDYDTVALRDVAKLYAKYDELYRTQQATPSFELKKEDLSISAYPANPTTGMLLKVPNGIKITHKPTGLSFACDEHRSQHKNRDSALEGLKALLMKEQEAQIAVAAGPSVEELAAAFRKELDALSNRNYELRMENVALKAAHAVVGPVVAYYNDNWTLTPRAYADAMSTAPKTFADMKPAYAAPSQDVEDAARYRALRAYMLSDDTQFDDQIGAATTNADFDSAIDVVRNQEGK